MSSWPASPESGTEWKMDEYVLKELMGPHGAGEHSRALDALPMCPQIPLPFLHMSTGVQTHIPSLLSAHNYRRAFPQPGPALHWQGLLSLSVCAKSLQCLGTLERKALNQIVMGESESRSVMSNSLRAHGLYSPWNSPGQDTGVGSLSLLQGFFPTQGSNPHCRSFTLQVDSIPAEPLGKPKNTGVGSLSFLQWIFPTQE